MTTLLLVDFDDEELAVVVEPELSRRFQVHSVVISSARPRVRMRGWQLNGEDLLSEVLRLRGEHGTDLALGMTNKNLYVPDMNFIFGLASREGRSAIVSGFRLGASQPDLFRQRLLKEAMHEVGHLYGLGHCEDPRCVMRFSNSLADTDVKGSSFCGNCASQLTAEGRIL